MTEPQAQIDALQQLLSGLESVAVAASGGVDSLTLGIVANRTLGQKAGIWHALSPAVPTAATERLRETAVAEGWNLQLIQAGEFEDENYLANPYRRCFHCKSRLYSALASRAEGVILSGTNADDMGDFRPGLEAAKQHGVRHPYVECGINKADIRRIARHLGFPGIAELPASPCLSSRVETGLRIQAPVLGFVDRVENLLSAALQPDVVRCRIRSDVIAVQLDVISLDSLADDKARHWQKRIGDLALPLGLPTEIHFEPYRMGSAFVDVT
jgi:uncharacterized protein